eukprot:TRINITY_DN197_c0_g1_i1.p2 TRINITY_DN197_c0_g1~~TRINITY_DN197_c0_g1_i1.p2  ORF type:complete len:260 (-),score=40.63 TRINITY_DN197_c0_g1_i1:122-901(-)
MKIFLFVFTLLLVIRMGHIRLVLKHGVATLLRYPPPVVPPPPVMPPPVVPPPPVMPPPVVPPPPPATGTINYQVWIEPQNAARATYGLPALVVDPYLAQLAQQYTDTCVYALPDRTALATAYRTLTGLTAPTFGRNLGKASRGSAKPTIWLDQKSSWTCSSNTCSGSLCGIWTQIIWATSTKIGCGLSSCPNNEDIFVCIYTPAGNTNGVHPFGTETWRCNSPITSFQSTEVETTHARTRGRARGRARSRSSRGRTNYF